MLESIINAETGEEQNVESLFESSVGTKLKPRSAANIMIGAKGTSATKTLIDYYGRSEEIHNNKVTKNA